MSGAEVIAALNSFGFAITSQRGSHVKMRRVALTGENQTLTIPNHREIDAGTLRAIIRQAFRYIPLEQMRPYFYC